MRQTLEKVCGFPPFGQLQQVVRERGHVLGAGRLGGRLAGRPRGCGQAALGRLATGGGGLVGRGRRVAGPQSLVRVLAGRPVDQSPEGGCEGRAQAFRSQTVGDEEGGAVGLDD